MAHSDKVFLPAGRRLKVSELTLSSEFERDRARDLSPRGETRSTAQILQLVCQLKILLWIVRQVFGGFFF